MLSAASSWVTVAVAQLECWPDDPDRTWTVIERGMEEASRGGADLVVLPELVTTGSTLSSREESLALAEPVDGHTITRLTALSTRHGLMVVAGWSERNGVELPWNSAVLIDSDEVLATYRKTHLWDAEKLFFQAGEDPPPVVQTRLGRLGLAICYDLEIPELVRSLARRGAQLLAVPANWPTLPRPADQLPVEVAKAQAAAAANRVHVAVADRCGRDRGQDWTGGSVVVGVDGYRRVGPTLQLATALEPATRPAPATVPGGTTVLMARLDLAEADDKAIGPRNDVFADLRPGIYG